MALTVHMITPVLSPGDAIGNYIQSLVRILRNWSVDVRLYADYPNPHFALPHYATASYRPTGTDILWLHFSIEAPSLDLLYTSPDFKIFDSHGVSPAALFHGYNPYLESLCAAGAARLKTFAPHVDLALAHTNYIVDELRAHHFRRIRTLPLVVDTARFTGQGDAEWEPLVSQLDYLLFVGRIVPQKGLARALQLFAALHTQQPQLQFLLVGSHPLPTYSAELEQRVAELGLTDAVIFTGPISDPQTLSTFYRHARFYLCLSEWESFCVPLVEAMYCGTPVLAHDVAPLPETMGPGGILLRGGPADMVQQIQAVAGDAGHYAALQRAGQRHVQQYTDQALLLQLRTLFAALANWS
ncbi:MAG: glycosyltransferase family 4 protein [Herpetosiphonaceae bacterium]|nr:glycosyltransferase family 4 protein [Herpetosiphonaceae bacterium]